MLMLGPPRCGKTSTFKEWARRRAGTDPAFKAAFTEIPANQSLKDIAGEVLKRLGDPDPEYGSQGARTSRIEEIGRSYDIILIDEIQRVIDSKTGKIRGDVANWATNLLNQGFCPIVFAGERIAETVFEDNPYLEGRLLGEISFEPYDWNNPTDQKEFRTFLHLIDKQLGMETLGGLGDIGTALRIHSYSDGRIGNATRLIDEGRSLAKKAGRPKITHEILAAAVDLLRIGRHRQLLNPFRVENAMPGGALPPTVRDGDEA